MDGNWKVDSRSGFRADAKVFRLRKVAGSNRDYRVCVDEVTTMATPPTDKIVGAATQSQEGASVILVHRLSRPSRHGTVQDAQTGYEIAGGRYQKIAGGACLVASQDHFDRRDYGFQRYGTTSNAAIATRARLEESRSSLVETAGRLF